MNKAIRTMNTIFHCLLSLSPRKTPTKRRIITTRKTNATNKKKMPVKRYPTKV